MLAALMLLACTAEPPVVEAVSPEEGKPGEALRVVGSGFVDGATVTLGGAPVADVSVKGLTLIEGTAPAGLAPGPQELVVENPDGQVGKKTGAFTVAAPPKELVPCGGEYTTYSAVATDSKTIKLDKHVPGDESKREIVEVAFRDVDAIEYSAAVGKDGKWCSAIIVRTTTGQRHLFDDDHDVDLKSRAQEIAQGIGRSIDVIADEERPKEEDAG